MIIFYIERHHFEFSTVLYTIIEKYRLTVTVYYVSIFFVQHLLTLDLSSSPHTLLPFSLVGHEGKNTHAKAN